MEKKGKPRRKIVKSMWQFRSAVTNGRLLSKDIDLRSTPARRLRDLLAAHTSDMGGIEALSEAERSLIRRASSLELQLEMLEHKWAVNDYEADHLAGLSAGDEYAASDVGESWG
jgi:hypothetical protein